jgi:solute carrier family 32 (vesicular inhibitory amino acid transporter)
MLIIQNCTSTVIVIVIINGLIKPQMPGSLRDPAATYLFPAQWSTLPLSFGLLLSPWGGHSVFPNVSLGFSRLWTDCTADMMVA